MDKTEASKKLHRFMISVLLSVLVWSIINYLVTPIGLGHFIIIEICIGIGELFSTFIKEKAGLATTKKDPE